jgi:hypothetical protein
VVWLISHNHPYLAGAMNEKARNKRTEQMVSLPAPRVRDTSYFRRYFSPPATSFAIALDEAIATREHFQLGVVGTKPLRAA